MAHMVLIVHLVLALAIIGLVLIQRSEGGGLGIGGGGGGLGGLASPQSTANVLTKITGICAALFFITSLTLAVLAEGTRPASITDHLEKAVISQGENADQAKEADEPAKANAEPSVPVAE